MQKILAGPKTCLTCHFLAKSRVDEGGRELSFSWDKSERENGAISEHFSAECWRGIWSTRVDGGLRKPLNEVLEDKRDDTCFYIEAQQGMLFQTAEELERARSANRELKRSYRYTQVGLWVAAVGLLANLVIGIVHLTQ